MQVPQFSPRISLIEMAPHPAPRSRCPGRLALPCLSPQTNKHHREQAVTGKIFQALPTQTDRHCCFNILDVVNEKCSIQVVALWTIY